MFRRVPSVLAWVLAAILLAGPVNAVEISAMSQSGRIAAFLETLTANAPFNRLHHWHLYLTLKSGQLPAPGDLSIQVGMRHHPHVLPTTPKIARGERAGEYVVEGVKFDRLGEWTFTVGLKSKSGADEIVFPVNVGTAVWRDFENEWTAEERAVLKTLLVSNLPVRAVDPGNDVAENEAAADFGHRLFFDTRLSANGKISCAGCHKPELMFTDGEKRAIGVGQTKRNAPTVIGAVFSPWQFWDGRKDSLWSQAMAPFEAPEEHGTDRAHVLRVVRTDADYRLRYEDLFGGLPAENDKAGIDRAFANLGKVIAAYEMRLRPGPAKFDRYVAAVLANRQPAPADQFTLDEIEGLRAFIADNQGQCIRCHSGPMFTDFQFHNIGSHIVGDREGEQGRIAGLRKLLADPANCHGQFGNDADECAELTFAKRRGTELVGAFKTPTLRFVSRTAPYMHAGQFQTLEDAIWQYRDVPSATVGQTELRQLSLADAQFKQIEVFLRTLDGPIDAPAKYLRPPPGMDQSASR